MSFILPSGLLTVSNPSSLTLNMSFDPNVEVKVTSLFLFESASGASNVKTRLLKGNCNWIHVERCSYHWWKLTPSFLLLYTSMVMSFVSITGELSLISPNFIVTVVDFISKKKAPLINR